MITICVFFFLFLLEGLAKSPESQNLFLFSLLPAIYFFEKSLKNEKIQFPERKIMLSFILFFGSLIINYFFSVDKINTVDKVFFYFIAFFIAIIALNEKEKIKKHLPNILIGLGFIFCFFSLNIIRGQPITALQFFYPLYPNHNHLGDFLGLVIIALLFIKLNTKLKVVLLLIFFPFFLFSFSRSAYLDLLIVIGLLFWQKKDELKLHRNIIVVFFAIIALFFIFTQKQVHEIPVFKPWLSKIDKVFKFEPRDILSSRPEYYDQGIRGFLDKPVFGWGLGNYMYPSNTYVTLPLSEVKSALNIFLTNLTELGVIGFVPYLLMIGLLFYSSYKNRNNLLFFYLALYQLLNFQTDYTYSITGFYLLFFLFLGLGLKDNPNKNRTNAFSLFSLILTIFIWLQITGQIFNMLGKYQLAKAFFPWQHQVWQGMIKEAVAENNVPKAKEFAVQYENFSSLSLPSLDFLTGFYGAINDKEKALKLIKVFKDTSRYPPFEMLKRVYEIVKKFQGKEYADTYFLSFYPQLKQSFYISPIFENDVYMFCLSQQIPGCRYKYFYEPKPNELRHPNPQIPFSRVENKMNNDGLNSSQNFSIEKPKGVFRIMALGGSETYGIYVKTQDNWPEQLKTQLNQKQLCSNIKKFEVINLAVDGDDLSYSIERYKLRGEKYNPDLIVLFVPNLYQLNEILLPKIAAYDQEGIHNKNYVQEVAKGNLYSAWTLAMRDFSKEMDSQVVLEQQRGYLNGLYNTYKGPALLVSYDYLSTNDQKFLQMSLKNQPNSSIYLIHNVQDNKKYQLPDGNLNSKGYAEVAKQLYNEIAQSLNICHVQ